MYYTGRSELYKKLLSYAAHNPLGGFGSSYELDILPPHNLFLFILVDYGWIACFLFITLLIRNIIHFCKISKNHLSIMFYNVLAASAVLFPFFSSISSCNEQRKVIWIILALQIRYMRMDENELMAGEKKDFLMKG